MGEEGKSTVRSAHISKKCAAHPSFSLALSSWSVEMLPSPVAMACIQNVNEELHVECEDEGRLKSWKSGEGEKQSKGVLPHESRRHMMNDSALTLTSDDLPLISCVWLSYHYLHSCLLVLLPNAACSTV